MSRVKMSNERVVELAVQMVNRKGWDALNLAALAQSAEVSAPSLYKHIDGLDGLRRDLALYAARRLEAALGEVIMGRSGDEAILAMLRAYRGFLTEQPGLGRALEQAPDPHDKELLAASEKLLNVAVLAFREKLPLREDALHAIRAVRAMVHGFHNLQQASGFGLPLSIDESFSRMIQSWLAGLRPSSLL
jgi:AcrR family transcriptional regulator